MLVVMVMMVLCFIRKAGKLVAKRFCSLHCGQNGISADLIPRGNDERCTRVALTNDGKGIGKAPVGDAIGMRENDAARVLDLIPKKLAEVFHIHLALPCINDGCLRIQRHIVRANVANGADDVAELSDARRLDQDTIGGKLGKNLAKGLSEIADETAADAARIHLGDLNTRVAHKSAVDANLAEFIFNQNEFFSCVRLADQLFDQGRFSRTEKARKHVNFRHDIRPLYKYI